MDGDLWHNGTRRLEHEHRRHLLLIVAALFVVIGGAIGAMDVSARLIKMSLQPNGWHGSTAVSAISVIVGFLCLLARSLRPSTMDRYQSVFVYTLLFGATVLLSAGTVWFGPRLAYALVVFALPPIFAFYLLPRRGAWIVTLLGPLGFGLIFLFQHGWPVPLLLWATLSAVTVATGVAVGSMISRIDVYANREQHARAEVAALNAELQVRVDQQVDEIARLGQLKRFLAPQVADVLSSGEADAILAPHRREIAVFFSDLRSFTRFTVAEAPEDVLTSLDEYYAAVCAILQRYDATIGSFSGDGIMAFVGDPLPQADAAGTAVRIALELRNEMTPLLDRWEARGFTLGYGVGIAMGYATIGLLGNEERSDYTAVGPVVNLASRLCAEATNGQILVDHRSYSAIKAWATVEPLEPVALKGFPEAVPMYCVTGTASERGAEG